MAAIVNISTQSDADFVYGFFYKVGGVGFNLAGTTMRMYVRKHAEDATLALSLTSADGDINYTTPATGGFSIRIKQSELERLAAGEYVHSLIMTTISTGIKTPIWNGKLVHKTGPSR